MAAYRSPWVGLSFVNDGIIPQRLSLHSACPTHKPKLVVARFFLISRCTRRAHGAF